MVDQLDGARVLIVEDEALIALDIAGAVEEAGGFAVGPAGSIAEALELLARCEVEAAICDVNLPDGDIGPVLAALSQSGVVVIVHTGGGMPSHLRSLYSHVLVCRKPMSSDRLTSNLGVQLLAQSSDTGRQS